MNRKFYHAAGRTVLVLALTANATIASAEIRREAESDNDRMPPLFGLRLEDIGDGKLQAKGIYRVPQNAGEETVLLTDAFEECVGDELHLSGVYVDGKYYLSYAEGGEAGSSHTSEWYNVDYSGLYSLDMRTLSTKHGIDKDFSCCTAMAYDESTGYVYATAYPWNLFKPSFRKIKFMNGEASSSTIAERVSFANLNMGSEGKLYEINHNYYNVPGGMNIYSIDIDTGTKEIVGQFDIGDLLVKCTCIDIPNNRILLNAVGDGSSYIYSVDLATYEPKCLYQINDNVSFNRIFIADDILAYDAPDVCGLQEGALSIPAGSLAGKLSLTAPKYFCDGTPGTGPLTLTVSADGLLVGSVQAEWGEPVDIELNFSAPGWYQDFRVVARNDAGESLPVRLVSRIFVGSDTPVAPKPYLTYIGGKLEVKWNPVTEGVNNGVMNLSDIRYSVSEKYGSLIERDITDCSWTAADNLSEISKYNAFSVNTFCGSLVSAAGYTNTVGPNCIKTPYEPDFNAAATRNGWEVFNLNDDGLSWHINREGLYFGTVSPSTDEVKYCNDWAISPAIRLQKGMIYIFSCDAEYNCGVPRLLVNLCEAPTPDTKIANITNITAYVPHVTRPDATGSEHLSKTFTVNEDGYYYLGFEMTGSVSYLGISNLKLVADPSGIDTAETDSEAVRAWGAEGTICIDGADGLGVTIAGIDGSVVFSGQGSSAMRIPAAPGIYIVKAGRAARKLTVR